MGVFTHTMADYTSPVAAARLFQAFYVDNHNCLPKALPSFVKSIDIVEGGSGTVGSIKQVNFAEGLPYKYAKNRVDEIDENKYYIKYTTIEADVVRDNIEFAVYEVKFEAAGDGTHYTMVVHYHTKDDYVVKDENVAAGKAAIKKMFNAVEQYLTANPQLYALTNKLHV